MKHVVRAVVPLLALLISCGVSPMSSGALLGTARAELTLVPSDVKCILFNASGPDVTIPLEFDVTPGTSATFTLTGIPVGTDTFTAWAYGVPCSQILNASPLYVSDPVTVEVTASSTAAVTLVMKPVNPNGGTAVVGVEFPGPNGRNTITVFDLPKGSIPTGIATGPDGHLWVTEAGTNRIARVAIVKGVSIDVTEFPVITKNAGLLDISPGLDGRLWFTMNTANKIGRISTTGAVDEFSLTTPGSAPGRIVTGTDGALWFSELGTGSVGRSSTGGGLSDYVFGAGGFGSRLASVSIAPGPDAMYFTILATGGGTLASALGRITTAGGTPGVFTPPTPSGAMFGVTMGPGGAMWFTEFAGGKIGRFETSNQTFTEFGIAPNSGPAGIVQGPDGNLWFIEWYGRAIGRITHAGVASEFGLPTTPQPLPAVPSPGGITAGPDGNIWFIVPGSDKIGRITP